MKKVKEIIGRLTAGSLRLAALFVVLGVVGSAWAADAPTITVNGSTVTIVNTTASTYQGKSLGMSSTWQSKNFTIPAGTGLDNGTILKISSISLGVSSSYSSYVADKLKIAGCVSSSDSVTSGGFAAASADKHTYYFADSTCLLKVGAGSVIKFLASDGSEITSGNLWFRTANSGHQFIDDLVWGGSAPVIEVVGEIVTAYYNKTVTSGNEYGFASGTGSGKVYVSGYSNYMKTSDQSGYACEKEIVLVDGPYNYAFCVNNGNSFDGNNSTRKNRFSVWNKISGDGTLTTSSSGPTPALKIYDSSEFTGTINTCAGIKMFVIFCGATETFQQDELYNKLYPANGDYKGSIYVTSARAAANSNVVTVPVGKTWTATTLLNEGETVIDGTFKGSVVNSGTLTINGTVTGEISNTGTVNVNAGGSFAFGSTRDLSTTSSWTIDPDATISVTMTKEEYGNGSISVTGVA
ncbi:MAG: hypothetical protein J6U31_09280, partial [Bacteroidales bacterium]|nr:hypothetical protein [Bacteroidales bacterium]